MTQSYFIADLIVQYGAKWQSSARTTTANRARHGLGIRGDKEPYSPLSGRTQRNFTATQYYFPADFSRKQSDVGQDDVNERHGLR